VEMKDNCFVDNDFRGSGAVLLQQTENPFAPTAGFIVSNYATTDDADLSCPFAAYFATDEDRRNSNFTCVPVQTDECGGEPIGPAIESPTTAPSFSSGAIVSSHRLQTALSAAVLLLGLELFC